MIKTLKKRFIVTAMLAVTILLVLLLGAINIFNVISTFRQSENLLNSIARPVMPESKNKEPLDKRPFEDKRMGALFFSVTTDPNGNIISVNTDISSITYDDAVAYLSKATKEKGRTNNFRYIRTESKSGFTYTFLDTTSDSLFIMRIVFISLMIGIICWFLMLLIVTLISNKAIKPIIANIEKQKQFVTDAGHEIKTPLAIIQANTDALELHLGETKWSSNIRAQITRLNNLTHNMLTLARIDETKQLSKADLNITALLNETFELFQPAFDLNGITCTVQFEENVHSNGNPELIKQLFSILTDNAAKYAAKNSAVQATLKKHEKGFIFTITNNVEVLPDCAPERLFDRFYRADGARTQKAGGYGIGLSAAQAICQIHAGSITADFEKNNSITFTVKM